MIIIKNNPAIRQRLVEIDENRTTSAQLSERSIDES